VHEHAFRILVICTGNASRSPAAERILAAGLGPTVAVASAGTAAAVGEPIAAEMVALLEREGIDATRFAARQVTGEMLRGADLVLPLARENLEHVVGLVPDAAERTFTLTEFAASVAATPSNDVVGDTPGERLRALVAAATRARAGRTLPAAPDIPNPYGHGQAAYEQAFAMIEQATGVIVAATGAV
jgi:protein-tyrosine-phosphatase